MGQHQSTCSDTSSATVCRECITGHEHKEIVGADCTEAPSSLTGTMQPGIELTLVQPGGWSLGCMGLGGGEALVGSLSGYSSWESLIGKLLHLQLLA